MYNTDDIKTTSSEEALKKRPEMFFGAEGATEKNLAKILSYTAETLGATKVKTIKTLGFICVCSNMDWLLVENKYGFYENNIFDRLWPFPENGVNSVRLEIAAKVFSSVLVSACQSNTIVIKGKLDNHERKKIDKLISIWERVICFKHENVL